MNDNVKITKSAEIKEAYFPLKSGKWQNEETGLIRHFEYPPKRGKWKRITFDKYPLPILDNVIWWV